MPFRLVLSAVLLLLQAYLYFKVRAWLRTVRPEDRYSPRAAAALFVLFGVATAATAFFRIRLGELPSWFLWTCAYPYLFWHSATIFLALTFLAVDLIRLPVRGTVAALRLLPPIRRAHDRFRAHPTIQRFDHSRRVFLRRSAAGLSVAAFGGTAYGMFAGREQCEHTTATVPVVDLPPAFHGFTIALVTDVHSGPYMSRQEMIDYVAAINALRADMVVVGGDFVNGEVAEVYPFAEAFDGLRAPSGVFGVMGNHDFYAEEPETVARVVSESGIRLLRDENITVSRGGASITLIGVDDPGRSRGPVKIENAMRGAAPGTSILLCHRPYYFPQAAERSIDLVLSGHTHGGQVVFGQVGDAILTPAALASRYVWGEYRIGKASMYVSRGIGTVGVPIRINCPPEITLLTLERSPGPLSSLGSTEAADRQALSNLAFPRGV